MHKKSLLPPFFAALLLALLPSIAHGQISVGFRIGPSINTFTKSPLENNEPEPKPNTSFQAAIPVEIGIGDVFALQPEIMLATHGGRQNGGGTSTALGLTSTTSVKWNFVIQSLEVPVLAKVRFGGDDLRFHLLAGPSFGFNTKGTWDSKTTLRVTAADGTVILDQKEDRKLTAKFLNDGYASSDLGQNQFAISKTNLNLHAGAGMGFRFGSASIVLDLRYMLGLSDMAPDQEGTSNDRKVTIKSNRLGLGLGFMYEL